MHIYTYLYMQRVNNNNKLYLHDCKFVTILQKRKLIIKNK